VASDPAKLLPMRSRAIERRGRIAIALLGVLVALGVLAQLLLPRIAASRISSRLGRYGSVERVSVTAWPAVKLLWGDADSVDVRARNLRFTPDQGAKLIWEGRGADHLDLAAATLQVGPLRLGDAHLRKRGTALSAEAHVSDADARAALPPGLQVQLVRSGGGTVVVSASGNLFGVGASVQAVALASEGRLLAHPLGFPLEGVRLTLFADPHVYVQGVSASRVAGGYRLAMTARLR